jgi:hypothetical protein
VARLDGLCFIHRKEKVAVSTTVRSLARVAAVLLMAVMATVTGATAASAHTAPATPQRTVVPASAGEFHEIVSQFNNHCLQASSTAPGAAIVQEPCNNNSFQLWFAIPTGSNIYRFVNQASGWCLWAPDTLTENAPLIQGECEVAGGTTVSNAQWVTDGTLPLGTRLRSDVHFSASNFCITVPLNGDGGIAPIRQCFGGSGQEWTVGSA